jgi:hypothetical protein
VQPPPPLEEPALIQGVMSRFRVVGVAAGTDEVDAGDPIEADIGRYLCRPRQGTISDLATLKELLELLREACDDPDRARTARRELKKLKIKAGIGI